MILITGSSGKTGKAVLKALLDRGASVRVLVHRQAQIDQLLQLGAQQALIGDLLNLSDLQHAMQGVDAVYHICPNVNPQELEIGQTVIAAAQDTGITRFVYHSVLHPQTEGMPHHWLKMRVEEKLLESGLNYTILQPAAYMQNILGQWDKIVADGIYAVPYNIHTRLSMVDLNNVAEVASKVLLDSGHFNAIYELSGAEAFSQAEVAEVISRCLGQPVRAEQTPLDLWEARARQGNMPEYALGTLLNMFNYYDRYGFCGNPTVLTHLLGRHPTTFGDFISRTISISK
jgi:uncharacterized protein YbjT (DUF2867 family)